MMCWLINLPLWHSRALSSGFIYQTDQTHISFFLSFFLRQSSYLTPCSKLTDTVCKNREDCFDILLFCVEDVQLLPSSKDEDNLWVKRPDVIALKQFQAELMEVSCSGRFRNQQIIKLQWTEVESLVFLCWENYPASRGAGRHCSHDTYVDFVMRVLLIDVGPESSESVARSAFRQLVCQFWTWP